MKVLWLIVCLSVSCLAAPPSPIPGEIQLTPEAEKLLEELVEIAGDHDPEETERPRRTSNFLDKKKFSLGSLSSYHHEDKYDKYHDFEHKAFTLGGLKKAILLSLVQAIKAITGGVIAVKGHLIKGGGKILETSGRIVEHKGAAVADLGKHIAYKALEKPISLPGLSGYGGYGHHTTHHQHTGYGAPPVYGPPSSEHHHYYHNDQGHSSHGHASAGFDYSFPHFHSKSSPLSVFAEPSEQKDKKALPDGVQAGLIILKPVKNEGVGHEAKVPPSAPHKDDGFYKFTNTGYKDDGYYKFDPIGDYSEPTKAEHVEQPTSFFSQSAPTIQYDKPSISRSIEYSYLVPQY